jgi:hypothetical protein
MASRKRAGLPKQRLPQTPLSTPKPFIVKAHRNTQFFNTTKDTLVAFLFVFAFVFLGADKALATATVTPASGGGSISADTAANGPSPAWTTLGAITIAEGAATDFAAGIGVTLILKTPAGFEFSTAVTPNITFTASRDITSATVAMTDSSTATITLTASGTTLLDTLTIGSTTSLQVRPTAGTPLASGNITVATSSTATVTGITKGTTSMGTLAELGGVVTQLAFTTQPVGATVGAAFTTQPVVKSMV